MVSLNKALLNPYFWGGTLGGGVGWIAMKQPSKPHRFHLTQMPYHLHEFLHAQGGVERSQELLKDLIKSRLLQHFMAERGNIQRKYVPDPLFSAGVSTYVCTYNVDIYIYVSICFYMYYTFVCACVWQNFNTTNWDTNMGYYDVWGSWKAVQRGENQQDWKAISFLGVSALYQWSYHFYKGFFERPLFVGQISLSVGSMIDASRVFNREAWEVTKILYGLSPRSAVSYP